jgi:lantibiotic transport system ATP-binding protein
LRVKFQPLPANTVRPSAAPTLPRCITMPILETHELSHRHGQQRVLDGLSLQVPAGSIYGFLGPNGAGKTTTLRLVLGLLRRQHGRISMFGQSIDTHRLDVLRRIGALIESPSCYEHLTARENLRVLQAVHRCPDRRIDEVLELVDLAHTGRKKAREFSLGMKQRLGIAAALLPAPELLILDEPTNGLDPNGILEIRRLLVRLNREQGVTILVSSHLLSEVEKLATDLGILHGGRLVFQGTLAALRARQHRSGAIHIGTSDAVRAHSLVAALASEARVVDGDLVVSSRSDSELARINRLLVENRVDVHAIRANEPDLESIFMDLIEGVAA